MEATSLVGCVKDSCAKLVSACKDMSQGVETKKCTEEHLVVLVKKVAAGALNVTSVVNEYLQKRPTETREKAELQENFVNEYTQGLREVIVALVRHTRDFYNNPLDFMTKQSLDNSLKEVAKQVKLLIDAAKALDDIDVMSREGQNSSPVPSSNSPSKSSDAITSTESGDISSEEANEIGNTVSEQSELFVKSMDQISAAIQSGDADGFIASQAVINDAIAKISKALQGIPNTDSALAGLVSATYSYMTASKAFFKNPDSDAYLKNYSESQKSFSTALKQLIFQVTRRNKLVGRSLSRGFSQRALTQNLRNSFMSTKLSKPTLPIISTHEDPSASSDEASSSEPKKSNGTTTNEAPSSPTEKISPRTSSNKPQLVKMPSHKSDLPRKKSDPGADISVSQSEVDLTESTSTTASSSATEKDTAPSEAPVEEKKLSTLLKVGTSSKLIDSSKKDKKEKEKEKKKKEKEKEKNKLKSQDSDSSLNSPKDKKSKGRTTPTATPSSAKLSSDDRNTLSSEADSPVLSRANSRLPTDTITTSSEDHSDDGASSSLRDSRPDLAGSHGKDSPDHSTPPPLARIKIGDLLGEISQREARRGEKESKNSDDELIDDSRDEDEDDKPSSRQVRIISIGAQVSGESQQATSALKRSVDTEKQQICSRIISAFCERFPTFKTEWEASDPMKKLLTENKIVAELAMYQINILSTAKAGDAIPKLVLPTAQSPVKDLSNNPSSPNLTPSPSPSPSTPTGSAEKSSGPKTFRREKTVGGSSSTKKSTSAAPSSLRLWSNDGIAAKESLKDSSSIPKKDDQESKEDAQLEELQRIASMKTTADLGGMTVRMKGAKAFRNLMNIVTTKEKGSSSPASNRLADNTTSLSQQFCGKLLEFIGLVYTNTKEPAKYQGDIEDELVESQRLTISFGKNILQNLKAYIASSNSTSVVLSDMLVKAEEDIGNLKTGTLQEIDSKLMNECQYSKLARHNIELSIYRWCSGLYSSASQIGTDIAALMKVNEFDQESEATALHLVSLFGSIINLFTLVMNDMITLHYLVINSHQVDTRHIVATPRGTSIALWSEEDSPKPDGEKGNITLRSGTFNQLIIRVLTSPAEEGDTLLNTFMDTLTSFTTASILIDKLWEAAKVPKDRYNRAIQSRIMVQICEVLQRLIKNCFKYEFDETCVPKIRKLLGELAKTIDIGLQVQQLINLIKETEQEEQTQEPLYVDLPAEVQIFEASDSMPHALILAFDSTTIAQQFTVIEFDIYKHITSDELKNQSWNKPKRMCIARNVCAMIQRANRISLWVATIILLQPKAKDRARVILRIISVARALRQLNNYNTLMGIIAGLNMSCVSRLKQTMTQVGKKALGQLKQLQQVVDPTSSFKTLREAIKQGGATQLPYIGTSLTDLTFIEDGNVDTLTDPDSNKEHINMEKREMLANVIRSVRSFQTCDYKITVRDPPYSLLNELPSLDERTLYDLSLEREPRTDTLRKTRG